MSAATISGARLTRRQLLVLVLLTLTWGLNWPVMKFAVSGTPAAPAPYPPLSFRALSMLIGLPVLALVLAFPGLTHWLRTAPASIAPGIAPDAVDDMLRQMSPAPEQRATP